MTGREKQTDISENKGLLKVSWHRRLKCLISFFQSEGLLFSVKATTFYDLSGMDSTVYVSVFLIGVNIISSSRVLVGTEKGFSGQGETCFLHRTAA